MGDMGAYSSNLTSKKRSSVNKDVSYLTSRLLLQDVDSVPHSDFQSAMSCLTFSSGGRSECAKGCRYNSGSLSGNTPSALVGVESPVVASFETALIANAQWPRVVCHSSLQSHDQQHCTDYTALVYCNMVPSMPVFRSLSQHWRDSKVLASAEVHVVVYRARTTSCDCPNDRTSFVQYHAVNLFNYFFSVQRCGVTLRISCIDSTNGMENYIFNFPPVSFDSSSDFTCPTTPAFTSYDYRNPSHASFPPDAVQTPPQPLLPPSSSDGYPALDLALLAISILQIELSLTSKTSPPTEAPTSNVPSVSSMAVLSTCPNTGVPVGCNDKVSAAKPTANKSTWAAQNPGWPVTNAVSPASLHCGERTSEHACSIETDIGSTAEGS
ncbi:hypothetical protein EDD15DRAFT_2194614 [Pisolithus albus]|nr:hypothetical protein EDD15DRAFT_2194614 [Pisolithus albus]